MEEKTLANRIFRYNITLIILPIFAVFAIGLIGLFIAMDAFNNERVNENAVVIEQYFESLDEATFNENQVDIYLDDYEFEFYMSKNGSPLVNKDGIAPFNDNMLIDERTSVVSMMGYTYVTRKININYDTYILMAAAENHSTFFIKPGFFFNILAYSIITIVIVLLLTSLYLTRRLSKSIEEPLEKIIRGTNRIKKGNLDEKIIYEKNEYEEFERVCDTFNEMMDQLKENIEKNKKIEHNRKVLIAGISHDLKTPLTSIKGYTKGLIDGVANTDEKRNYYLKTIYEKTETLENLFNQLVLVSDLQSETMDIRLVKTNISKYISNFIQEVKMEYSSRNINFIDNISVTNCYVNIDQVQFGRVLFNIVNNSIKYVNKELIEISFNVYEENEFVKIEIKDNGEGVPNDKLEEIFDLFYRLDSSRTGSQNGSGLGLAICKTIIEAFHGTIKAINDSGLKLIITLPKEVK